VRIRRGWRLPVARSDDSRDNGDQE